jgi:DNA replication protein DnaC
MSQTIDGARLTLLLNDLRLPAIKQGWAAFAERADKEGWPAARFLAALAEHEIAERDRAASSAISSRPGCCRARHSTPSSSRRCRWFPRRM